MPQKGFHYTGTPGARKLSPKQVMALAAKYGLPPKGIMQIAKGESGLDAAVQQRDPGDGMVGYGLLQMTPNAWGAAAKAHLAKLGGIKALSDPEVNMAMARYLYKGAGNSFKPWYGTRYLTDRSGEGTLRKVNPNARVAGVSGGGGATSTVTTTGSVGPSIAELLSTLGTQETQPLAPAVLRAPASALSAQAPMAMAPTPAGYQPPSEYVTPGSQKPDYLAALDALQAQQQATTTTTTTPGGGGGGGTNQRNSGGLGVKGELYELIWRGPGSQTVKNGQPVDRNFYNKHEDHVHVAARQKDILKLGRAAERMGLHVGENPAFGSVTPVHVGGSFHYGRHEKRGENDRAIDVSGDVAAMKKFARLVRQAYRV